jgi:hypothetical protein
MRFEGRTKYLVIAIIAVVGISGIIEALPHAQESASDLLLDAGILALIILVSVLLARKFGKRNKPVPPVPPG